jgi:hypothetical protein
MDLRLFGHGNLMIAGLIVFGAGLLIMAIRLNHRMALSVLNEDRHHEKRLEFQRNTFTQLGVLLVGIGVSLFIFYFQQDYQQHQRHLAEVEQVLAKIASRVGRATADLEYLPEYDAILDDGGPYIDPESGGRNRAVTATGAALAAQIEALRLVERDVSLEIFDDLFVSTDLQGSSLMAEIDPAIWFAMHRDENDLRYAITQLAADYRDLADALGGKDPSMALSDPEGGPAIKREVLDILYDMDLLRDRSRRALARACWFVSQDRDFVELHPLQENSLRYASHIEWIEQARIFSRFSVGGENCFDILSFHGQAPD